MRLITTGVVVAILALVTVLARREGGEPPEDPERPSYRMPRAYPAVFRVCAAGFLLGAAFCAYTLYRGNPTAAGALPVILGAAALCLLPLNRLTWLMSLPALFLAMSYPFTKRFFPLPQLYLGLAFSFGIPMAFAAVTGHVPPTAWLLFAANVLWTLAYDTAYAMADKEDDLKIGIKTSAITFGRRDAEAVLACHLGFTALMIWLGLTISAAWPYWPAVPLALYWQIKQYRAIRQRDRNACFREFLANNRLGALWFAALLANYLYFKIAAFAF